MGTSNRRRVGIVLLSPVIAALAGWLTADQCEETCPPAKIASVEASLPVVQVTPNTALPEGDRPRQFRLSAWFRDGADNVVIGRFGAEWSFAPLEAGTVDGYGGVTVQKFPGSSSAEATVQARNPLDRTLFADVKVTRWADAAAAGASGDVIDLSDLPHPAEDPPRVALVEEKKSGSCQWGVPRAFVGAATVGGRASAPCSVSVLSADRAMFFDQSGALAGPTIRPTTAPPTQVDITVFLAVTASTPAAFTNSAVRPNDALTSAVVRTAAAIAELDIGWANDVYRANRVGIEIKATYVQLFGSDADLAAKVGAHPFDCYKPRALTDPAGSPGYAYEPGTISVYYVDWIDYPSDPVHAGSRGVQCPYWYTGATGPVIYVSYTRHSQMTLAHEIGHALGLNDEESGFGALNLMYSLAPDGPLGADARSQLTLGQVFRMNVWNWSYLIAKSSAAPKRGCDDAEPCPPVAFDVR